MSLKNFWFFVDETNMPPKEGQFFIYGGVVVDSRNALELSKRVDAIRIKNGYVPGENLKFTNKDNKNAQSHKQAKSEVLELMAELEVKFLVNVVHQSVLRNRTEVEFMSWGMNSLVKNFHEFLSMRGSESVGALFFDRVDKEDTNRAMSEMADRFQNGLEWPSGYNRPINDKVLVFAMTNNNSSYFSSCADIALGSFRYCVNAATGHENAKPEVAKKLMPFVNRLFWREQSPSGQPTKTNGYFPHPVEIRSAIIQNHYDSLTKNLNQYIRDSAPE